MMREVSGSIPGYGIAYGINNRPVGRLAAILINNFSGILSNKILSNISGTL